MIAVGKPTAEDGSLFAIRDEHDVALLEQNKPTLFEAEGSTYELLARGAALAPQSPALSFFLTAADYQRPWSWTYGEWLGRITQTANMFRKLGVERQDVIAFVMPNLPETHWVIWGGEAAGIVFAINPLLEAPLILDLLLAAKAKWLVTIGPTPGIRYLAKGLRGCSSRAFPARNTDRQSFQIFARSSRHLVRSAGAGPNAPEIGASQSPRSDRRMQQARRRRAYL